MSLHVAEKALQFLLFFCFKLWINRSEILIFLFSKSMAFCNRHWIPDQFLILPCFSETVDFDQVALSSSCIWSKFTVGKHLGKYTALTFQRLSKLYSLQVMGSLLPLVDEWFISRILSLELASQGHACHQLIRFNYLDTEVKTGFVFESPLLIVISRKR